uniref:Uncharacterized protein n=1 Tax=viral metagenome TaxID=1070528 RepID=A0A6M3L630_9ZZZZ
MDEKKKGDLVDFEYWFNGVEYSERGEVTKVLKYHYEIQSENTFTWEKPEDLVFYIKKTEVF